MRGTLTSSNLKSIRTIIFVIILYKSCAEATSKGDQNARTWTGASRQQHSEHISQLGRDLPAVAKSKHYHRLLDTNCDDNHSFPNVRPGTPSSGLGVQPRPVQLRTVVRPEPAVLQPQPLVSDVATALIASGHESATRRQPPTVPAAAAAATAATGEHGCRDDCGQQHCAADEYGCNHSATDGQPRLRVWYDDTALWCRTG
ncbi:hypothetical protein CC80DRAFT_133947 [Byssothecium circinans]|uniref:Secreted protein n=1 Tax=Byssothecium circinans TaxID=147558 RepID=A0A6A5TQG1_9PLEO|nr:hypothetical protein CC80DRAFT_133947 [Byssothecium circinans]